MSDFNDRRGAALDLERRVLAAARREEPSPELSAKMARAIGLSAGVVASLSQQTANAASSPLTRDAAAELAAGGQQGLAAAGSSSGFGAVVPWVAGTTLAAALAAGITFIQWGAEATSMPPASAPLEPHTSPELAASAESERETKAPGNAVQETPSEPAGEAAAKPSPADLNEPRGAFAKPRSADPLRDEIALMDKARAAVRAGSAARALTLIGEYDKRYPKGSFRPEATALRVEALVGVGRKAEARALAERFVASRKGTPLADRVARVAGLPP